MEHYQLPIPGPARNLLFKTIGTALFALVSFKRTRQGYGDPRPFPVTDFNRAIDYDLKVIREWREYLNRYLSSPLDLRGQVVLELGPGADLGVGLALRRLGCSHYKALDAVELVRSVPLSFYQALFQRLEADLAGPTPISELSADLECWQWGRGDRLNHVVREDFDPGIFGEREVDLVVSQAAFEHFDDVGNTLQRLEPVVKPGGLLCTQIDLETHTRYIREMDPLNIYRMSDGLYRRLHFTGAPNRVRPRQYVQLLESHGWRNVRVFPMKTLAPEYVAAVEPHLNPRFRGSEIEILGMMLCATKD
jgi:SAM-dependent methyltransferase